MWDICGGLLLFKHTENPPQTSLFNSRERAFLGQAEKIGMIKKKDLEQRGVRERRGEERREVLGFMRHEDQVNQV